MIPCKPGIQGITGKQGITGLQGKTGVQGITGAPGPDNHTKYYWANVQLQTATDTTKEPIFKTATVQNDATNKCKMAYDSTEECLKFIFS